MTFVIPDQFFSSSPAQLFLFVLTFFVLFSGVASQQFAQVYSWKAGHGIPYPEQAMLDQMGKSNSAITFSGGGLRSYMATLGYFRGLLDLGLMNRTRYISSVSGGSWATTAYIWHQPQVAKTPEQFLGPIYPPKHLTWEKLQYIAPHCARREPTKMDLILKAILNLVENFNDPLDVWYKTIDEVFLKPVGINWKMLFSWNRATAADALRRNPWLEEFDFVLPCGGAERCDHKPFPVINTAILGPEQAAPFSVFDLGFTMLETTPLYIGSPNPHNVTYKTMLNPLSGDSKKDVEYEMRYGGLVEPFGFGGFPVSSDSSDTGDHVLPGPFFGLGPNETVKLLKVPRPDFQFTLANASGTSSWAPGSLLAELDVISNILDRYIGLRSSYWSPISPAKDMPIFSTRVLLGDGGALDNQGLCAMLRRKVKNIVVFVNTPVPLRPRSQFNPYLRLPKDDDIDSGISAYFGYFDFVQNPVQNIQHNHVFSHHAFPYVIDQMQRAQQFGNGIVAKTTLSTIENKWWGIEGGHEVNVLWVYLGRTFNWEKQLPEDVRRFVVPKDHPEDPTSLPTYGVFESFPHVSTSKLDYSPELANLLANLAGWTIQKNWKLFKELLN